MNTTTTSPQPTAIEIKAHKVESSSELVSNMETANLIEGYHVIAEWIRFADAKAAVVLTVGGAIAGMVVPTLKGYLDEDVTSHLTPWWTILVMGLFGCWLVLVLLSGMLAFRCISPFRQSGRHPSLGKCAHFHPAAISAAFDLNDSDRFIDDCERMGDAGLRREVAACLLIDSHISSTKYALVTKSIRLLGASAFAAFAYLLAIQF